MMGAKPFLTQSDLHTLKPGEWQVEAVIDYYMHCLHEHQKKYLEEQKPCIVCHFFWTDFYLKFHSNPEL
jgi:Ulp1 family protease